MRKRYIKETALILIVIVLFAYHAADVLSDPVGATVIPGKSSRRTDSNVTNLTAQGGNVTWLGVDSTKTSAVWQGYFGNVSGGIVLEDGGGNVMYDWNVVDIG